MDTEIVIVIAEDEQSHFILTRNYLQRCGINNKIVWLRDGQATLDYLNKHAKGVHQDKDTEFLILLDIRMPKVNGEQVLLHIRADQELRNLPVVMLTCSDNPSEIERYHAMGCSAYLTKPVKLDTFLNTMKQLALHPAKTQDGIKLTRKIKSRVS
ncbi:MAG: response regulator [Anaerohalosphaera sp.]|nr:response regulator [Anaerohalosphaera sp.]